jgi:hypothetical protein
MRPSPALLVAVTALVVAMSGAAVALPGKSTVSTNDIRPGAITKKLIAKGAVGSAQIVGKSIKGNRLKDGAVKAKQLADEAVTTKKIEDGAVTAKQIADGTITSKQVAGEGLTSKNLSDYAVIASSSGAVIKLTATNGAGEAAARAAAPSVELFAKGQITITAKCFRDATADTTFAEIYAKASANGAIFEGFDELSGGPAATDFLNANTPENQSRLAAVSVTGPAAALDDRDFDVVGADGTHLLGQTSAAAKDGELAGGNGVYGVGNVCLIGGEITG